MGKLVRVVHFVPSLVAYDYEEFVWLVRLGGQATFEALLKLFDMAQLCLHNVPSFLWRMGYDSVVRDWNGEFYIVIDSR